MTDDNKKTILHACLFKNQQTKQPETIDAGFTGKRAAFLNDVEWPSKSTIKVGFFKKKFVFNNESLDPEFSVDKANFVKSTIEKYFIKPELINLSFIWDTPLKDSDIRITFVKALGSFSELGIQAKDTPKDKPTMNLGWLDNDIDFDKEELKGTGAVVIHEFGHFLGLIHEHSRGDASLTWNKELIIKEVGAPPNSWTPKECEEQIFTAYDKSKFNGSEYDADSIMHYYFPSKYFDPPVELKVIKEMSKLDKEYITKKYPGGGCTSTGDINGENAENSEKSIITFIIDFLVNYKYLFLFILVAGLIILVLTKKESEKDSNDSN